MIVGAVSAGVARWRHGRARSGIVALLVLWGCLGALRMAAWEAHPDMGLRDLLSDDPRPVTLHARVINDPAGPFDPEEPSRQVCVLQLLHARQAARWQSITGRVRATLHTAEPTLAYGDEVVVEGEWFRVPPPGNPGQYDWREALARQRVHGLLRVKPFDGLVRLRQEQANPWIALVIRLRRRWGQLLDAHFDARDAGLLRSLLLGQRVALDEQIKAAFVETGTIHLLVISGFNVGLVAGLLGWVLGVAGLPWRLRLPVVALGLGGYCLLTGLQPPVARATVMAWIVLGAYALDRVISWPNTLAAAALAILWINPTQAFDAGFQLSFGAVLSLLVLMGRWRAGLERRLGWVGSGRLRRYVAMSLSATSAIWVGLSPVLAWYFHLVSPVSMVANLLLAPLLSALVSIGTALLMVGTGCEMMVQWGSGLLSWLLDATLWCVFGCHAIPGGFWFVGRPSLAFLIGYYGLVGLSVSRSRLGLSGTRLFLCWMCGLAVWLWALVGQRVVQSRWLRVDLLDVGHGDSIVVRTPGGRTLLVDAGVPDAGRYRVVPFLRAAGISTLEALLLTHPDADHIGGAVALLEQMRIKRLLTNGVRDDTMSARQVWRAAAAAGVEELVLSEGLTLSEGEALTIEVLHPPGGLVPETAPDSNDNSLVLKLTHGSVSFLLCGDVEEAGLPWLLRHGPRLRSSVLKVPHHGSRLGQGGERLFSMVQPEVAILSVGRAHHLPAPETLRALRKSGARLYSTREAGAISLRTDGKKLLVKTFRKESIVHRP